MAIGSEHSREIPGEAAFVFVGKVVRTRAATMAELAADNTAIVHVERVVSAPEMFLSLVGHDVTVRLGRASALSRGNRRIFYANGWIFGSSVAVDVVRMEEDTGGRPVASAVRDARTASADSMLSARLASAVMSVVGTVAEVTKSDKNPSHISEHYPDWHEATIDVDEVIKGRKGTKQAKLLFPNSDDVRWYKAGKFKVGQQGIWMLQPGARQDPAGVAAKILAAVPEGTDVLTALHQVDYLPLHELERVRALAKQ